MGDLFHDDVPFGFALAVYACVPTRHRAMVLTKRPARARKFYAWLHSDARYGARDFAHIWLGVSVEDQPTADDRVPLLLQIPAAHRFVSCEPLLGPVLLDAIWDGRLDALSGAAKTATGEVWAGGHALDWVICGGESGPGARLMHPEWARNLRDQCRASGVPFFFKQWGAWVPGWETAEGALREYNRRVGKKAAGHLLDGVEHLEFPRELSKEVLGDDDSKDRE